MGSITTAAAGEIRRSGIQIGPAYANGQARAETILGVPFQSGRHWAEVLVTPGKASMILAAMPTQRPASQARIKALADIIRDGGWLVTHQGIAFNEDGYLIDGQHRLSACVEAGMPIRVVATFNAPQSTMAVVDRGKSRNIADDLVMLGLVTNSAHSQLVQAAGRILWNLDGDRLPWVADSTASGRKVAFAAKDCAEVMQRHGGLVDTCGWVLSKSRKGTTPPAAPFAAFLALFREVNESKAMGFAEQILNGEGLTRTDPTYLLRESLRRTSQSVLRDRASNRIAFMVRLVYAWNAYWEGRQIATLYSVPKHGDFPKIAGYLPEAR